MRILGPRRRLPSTRALTGGLLVAIALVATWWAASGGAAAPARPVVVATRPLAAGDRITADDVRIQRTGDGPLVRRHGFTDPAEVVGSVAAGPVAAGEPLLRSATVPSTGSRTVRELSFVVDPDWAVGGTLRVGDRIDLLVTYGDGATSQTSRVLSNVAVRRLAVTGDAGLGSSRSEVITVAIGSTEAVQAATNAARAGTVTVVRATGAVPVDGVATYRPPAADRPRR